MSRPEGDGIHWTNTVHCGRIFCIRCGPPKAEREATDVSDAPDSAPDDAIGAKNP